jgi:hypothetical protein
MAMQRFDRIFKMIARAAVTGLGTVRAAVHILTGQPDPATVRNAGPPAIPMFGV